MLSTLLGMQRQIETDKHNSLVVRLAGMLLHSCVLQTVLQSGQPRPKLSPLATPFFASESAHRDAAAPVCSSIGAVVGGFILRVSHLYSPCSCHELSSGKPYLSRMQQSCRYVASVVKNLSRTGATGCPPQYESSSVIICHP